MSYKKRIFIFIGASVIFLILGALAEEMFEIIGQFTQLFSFAFLIMFIILAFLSEEILSTWKKFSFWFIPISAILIILAPNFSDPFTLIPDKEITVLFASSIYLLISLILIIHKSLKFRKEKK